MKADNFSQVYDSLKAITDPVTGVAYLSKIVLGVSTASNIGYEIDSSGKLTNGTPNTRNADISRVYARLAANKENIRYSDTYRNPYVTYTNEAGQRIFLWYEDSRSVATIHTVRVAIYCGECGHPARLAVHSNI